jgi:hypothetical protein
MVDVIHLLPVLTKQALANQHGMVRHLVESGLIPVDVRAGGAADLTPLLAISTESCCLPTDARSLRLRRPTLHNCGAFSEAATHAGERLRCVPMLPMALLLLELGADLHATDRNGACILAVSAQRGYRNSLFQQLVQRFPELLGSCHAGRVLCSAAVCSIAASTDVRFKGANADDVPCMLECLRSSYAARGQQQQLVLELNAPIQRSDLNSKQPSVHSLTTNALDTTFRRQPTEPACAIAQVLHPTR